MLIGFLGDVHGRVFDAIAALATWQERTDKRFDLLVQVGDLGAFPDPTRTDAATSRYLEADPAEADFSRLLRADGGLARGLRRATKQFAGPIHFLRGNQEDFVWLAQLPVDPATRTAPVDPFDLFRYVPDETVLEFDRVTLAFLGGVEEHSDARAIDRTSYQSLMDLGPGTVDVLVTHQGPYGSSMGFRGDVHGSHLMTRLVEHLRPAFHVAGHAHQLSGPTTIAHTTYLGLDGLVPSARWHPEEKGLKSGCLGVLDTETASLQPVTDSWLGEFETPIDFDAWSEGLSTF